MKTFFEKEGRADGKREGKKKERKKERKRERKKKRKKEREGPKWLSRQVRRLGIGRSVVQISAAEFNYYFHISFILLFGFSTPSFQQLKLSNCFFSVDLICKEELNLMLKVSDF